MKSVPDGTGEIPLRGMKSLRGEIRCGGLGGRRSSHRERCEGFHPQGGKQKRTT